MPGICLSASNFYVKLLNGSSRKFYHIITDRAFFHNLSYIFGGGEIFIKILSQMYPWTRKSPLNFGSNLDPESVSGYGVQIQTIFSLADMCGL